jgi:hypothetical protein
VICEVDEAVDSELVTCSDTRPERACTGDAV